MRMVVSVGLATRAGRSKAGSVLMRRFLAIPVAVAMLMLLTYVRELLMLALVLSWYALALAVVVMARVGSYASPLQNLLVGGS
jgi:hypothetical protein